MFALQVVHFGMNKTVGQLSFETPEPGQMVMDKPYSEKTAQMIDEEVRKIVEGAYTRTFNLLTQHKENVEKVNDLCSSLCKNHANFKYGIHL